MKFLVDQIKLSVRSVKQEKESLQRLVTEMEIRFKQLQDKLNSSIINQSSVPKLLDSLNPDALPEKESTQVLALKEEIKQLRITQDIQ